MDIVHVCLRVTVSPNLSRIAVLWRMYATVNSAIIDLDNGFIIITGSIGVKWKPRHMFELF